MNLNVEFHLVIHPSKNIIFDYTEIQSNFNGNDLTFIISGTQILLTSLAPSFIEFEYIHTEF